LPENINEKKIMEEIDYRKDVDCFHYQNIGKLSSGAGEMLPCTPAGIIEIMKRSGVTIAGKECVIVGRSNIVGKPLAMMLLHENGTVTVAHSKTKNLADVCRRADILISAVGKPGFISKDMVKPGAVVIDVGINRTAEGKIVGDVDFENVCSEAQCITPVPGGVGPMTIAMLMKNTIEAAKNLNKN
jgi:methylenetetrahydrofolate dehydrogenase (NADP+)/methenyltetrahydrofolate cyclohydrolase